jgi:hypothetical protein
VDVGANERTRLLACRLGIPQLYGEQHDVDWTDLSGPNGPGRTPDRTGITAGLNRMIFTTSAKANR